MANCGLKCDAVLAKAYEANTVNGYQNAAFVIDSIAVLCNLCDLQQYYSHFYYALYLDATNHTTAFGREINFLQEKIENIVFESTKDRQYFEDYLQLQFVVYHRKVNNFIEAKKQIKAHRLNEISGNQVDDTNIYGLWKLLRNELASVHLGTSNYTKAIVSLKSIKAAELDRQLIKGTIPETYHIDCQIADNYSSLGNLEEATKYFRSCSNKAIELFKGTKAIYQRQDAYHYLTHLLNEIVVNLDVYDYKRAQFLFDFIATHRQPDNLINFYVDILNTRFLTATGKHTEVRNLFIAIERKLTNPIATNEIKLSYYLNKAEFETLEKNELARSNAIDSVIHIARKIESETDLWSHNVLRARKLVLSYYLEQKDINKGLEIITNFVTFLEKKLTQSILFDDHINLNQEVYPTLEACLKFIYESEIGDPNLVFRILECTKALSLYKETSLSILSAGEVKTRALEKYAELKENLLLLKTNSSSSEDGHDANLFEANRALEDLKEQIRSQHSTNISYPASLQTFQKSIEQEHNYSLIFSGSYHYYLLNLSSGSTEFERIDKATLDELIDKQTAELLDHTHIKDASSRKLFETLSKVMHLDQGKSLCISPDGNFQNITFGALKTTDGSYLNAKTSLYFTPSAHISLALANSVKSPNLDFGVFVPSNLGSQSNLLFAKEEGLKVHGLVGGHLSTDQDCTKEKFIQDARNYNIIHIATHATADTNDHYKSYISFTQTDSTDDKLYFDEINSVTLNAELVTLSACETNVGQNFNGEGVQSLSRNFIAAGAKSVISSMWSVNDQTTSEIIISFYTYLKKGFSKAESLQKAKIDYLENNPGEGQHPYYWAGLVLTGNPDAIFEKKSNLPYFMAGGILVLMGGILGRKKLLKLAA